MPTKVEVRLLERVDEADCRELRLLARVVIDDFLDVAIGLFARTTRLPSPAGAGLHRLRTRVRRPSK